MKRSSLNKYILPAIMLIVFETIAIILWLAKSNVFYLFNFSYIGISITLGLVLFAQNYKHARRVAECRKSPAMLNFFVVLWYNRSGDERC